MRIFKRQTGAVCIYQGAGGEGHGEEGHGEE